MWRHSAAASSASAGSVNHCVTWRLRSLCRACRQCRCVVIITTAAARVCLSAQASDCHTLPGAAHLQRLVVSPQSLRASFQRAYALLVRNTSRRDRAKVLMENTPPTGMASEGASWTPQTARSPFLSSVS
jgi:hypothetical protein